jgi:hypothetical protein
VTHWLLVSDEHNFETSRSINFEIAAMKTRWKKAAGEVRPGDTIFFYLTGLQVIAGESKVLSEAYYDDTTTIWTCSTPGEMYPWRFKTEPVISRHAGEYAPVKDFIANYEYATKWPPNRSSLAFQGNVHRLNDHDYELIHTHLLQKN